MKQLYGALEAGGTKMVCAIIDGEGDVHDRLTMPTSLPCDCIPHIEDFFRGRIERLGIGTFGPVDIDPGSPGYGDIGTCVKKGWSGYPLGKHLGDSLNVPYSVDTDVNAACLGECTYGDSKGLDTVSYITVGTGIGVGLCISGKPFHGNRHPEGGHIKASRADDDTLGSLCPFHSDCIEGLASGPALHRRFGRDPSMVPENHPGWIAEVHYISQLVSACLLMYSPDRVILGGGVMKRRHLFPLIRESCLEQLNGYLGFDSLDDVVTPESLNGDQGILGSARLAMNRWDI